MAWSCYRSSGGRHTGFYAAASAGAGAAAATTAVTTSGAAQHSPLAAGAGHFWGSYECARSPTPWCDPTL